MRVSRSVLLAGCAAAMLWAGPGSLRVCGQTATGGASGAGAPPPPPPVTMYVQDGSLRAALTQLFDSAHVQYSIDNRVTGFVSLKIVDQPFEAALRLLIRASGQPLLYRVENGVYFVAPRTVAVEPKTPAAPQPAPEQTAIAARAPISVITLIDADPYDLASLLGITIVRTGTRFDALAGGTGATGGAPAGGGAPGAGSASAASGNGKSGAIGGGNLVSSDANNDLIRIPH